MTDDYVMVPREALDLTAVILVSLMRSGINADVRALLTHGDERGTVAPGALQKAVETALSVAPPPPAREAGEKPLTWRDSIDTYRREFGNNPTLDWLEHDMAEIYSAQPPAREAGLREHLRNVLKEYDRNICLHEDTYRGGYNWTICRGCGRKWADDEGGFKAHVDPPVIDAARAALSQQQETGENK